MLEGVLLGGRYKLGAAIGAGSSGTVFRARDQRTSGEVAVKVVPPGFDAERLASRLRREASVLRRITSRHVARILDSGEDVPGTWLAMELVDGVALSPAALGRPLYPHEVLRVARGLLEGLSATHEAGIIHGDVKPANILVPRATTGFDAVKLVDFGIASAREDDPRGARFALETPTGAFAEGGLLGTARYLAPEALGGRPVDPRADVYATGLVLFELLGAGTLFGGSSLRDELRARLEQDPRLDGRVPSPLASVLARMLARDPQRRYPDAAAVLSVIVDLDTAPVSASIEEAPPSLRPALRRSSPIPPIPSLSAPRVPAIHVPQTGGAASTSAPRVSFSGSLTGLPSLRPGAPLARLDKLVAPPELALVETLRHLDLAMLDALARRERGSVPGRVARALALSLRLELDAAALVLEPLVASHPLARAVAVTVLGPRARRVTRGRVGADRDEPWDAAILPELGALLAAVGAATSPSADAARDLERIARAKAALGQEGGRQGAGSVPPEQLRARDAARGTLELAHLAARVRTGELDVSLALERAASLIAAGRAPDGLLLPLDRALRSMFVATMAGLVDAARARDELERAHRVASETGATLLEVVSGIAWGALLVQHRAHEAHGLALLERVSTLVAHGDAPTLDHAAQHHRATALVARGEWTAAIAPLQLAREAASAERAVDAEVMSTATELAAHLAIGDAAAAQEVSASLPDSMVAGARPRAAAFAWVARALAAFAADDTTAVTRALDACAVSVASAPDETIDAQVVLDAVRLLVAASRGAADEVSAGLPRLERLASTTGFAAYFWTDVLRAVVRRAESMRGRGAMLDTLERVTVVLGRSGNLARERPTSAPPPPAV